MAETVALVLAGGKGQRLWPLSRESRPKQFVPVVSEQTLIATTVNRLLSVFPKEHIFVSTTERYANDVLDAGLPIAQENLILERRPLGPATAFSLAHAILRERYSDDVRVFSCPSDHYVQNLAVFTETLKELVSQDFSGDATVVALGAKPTEPDDRLGYFLLETTGAAERFRVSKLIEKPSLEEAERIVASGMVCWNTAYYLARPGDVLDVLGRVHPEQAAAILSYAQGWVADPSQRQYGYDGAAVPGHELAPFLTDSARIDVLVRDLGWSDVGTWERVLQVREQTIGADPAALAPESSEIVAISTDGRPIVACGVADLIIVSHKDAVYVLNRSSASDAETIKRWRSAVASAGKDALL